MNGNIPRQTQTDDDKPADAVAAVVHKQEDEDKGRDKWGSQAEFLLACLGNAVGLGNCWRFPYLCYKNGGGAFLVPYVICCLVIGLPLFFIEVGLGQYSAMGPAHLYANLSPIFKGVGLASVISSVIVAIYYNMIIAWTIFYLFEAVMGQKWQSCDNWFNTINCTTMHDNATSFANNSVSSTEEFFNNYVLAKSDGIEELTSLNYKLALALLVSWVFVVLALIKGIQSSGKVVYFTATFPYVILVILFARGITLPGAYDGLHYYFTPNWDKVNDIEVWRDAAIQVFYSFGIGGGGMITYASYNRFNNPVITHALLVGVGDFLTSIFCGSVVFTMIGYMARTLNKPIEKIVTSGSGLAFIVIPEGLSQMPVSSVWSLLFFAMLFLLGIDSQFAMVETTITYIFDSMRHMKVKINKPAIVTLAGCLWFLAGLPLCTNAGIYILNLMDTYAAGIPCLVVGFLEIFIITYIYGIDKFFDNLKEMTQWRPKVLLQSHLVVMITALAPAVIMVILYKEMSVLFKSEAQLKYGTYHYPHWAIVAGWALVCVSLAAIPLGVVHQFFRTMCSGKKAFCQRLRLLKDPTDRWWANAMENNNNASNNRADTLARLTRDSINLNNKANMSPDAQSTTTTAGHVNPSFVCTEF